MAVIWIVFLLIQCCNQALVSAQGKGVVLVAYLMIVGKDK
jgi:hypothetical protein